MTSHSILVLRRDELDSLKLGWGEIIRVLEDAFLQKAAGQVQNPPKPKVVPRPDAFVNAMPAYLGGSDLLGLKWVSGHGDNPANGHPYIYGSLIMNDAGTGRPLALIDGSWVTEMRTPAVSGLAMRQVNGQVGTLSIIGCGAQGRRHLTVALTEHPEVHTVRTFDRSPDAVRALAQLADGRKVVSARSPSDAIEGADMVVTGLTAKLDPPLEADRAADDAVFLPLDYDDAIAASVANGATAYVVDDRGQYDSVLHRAFHGFRDPDAELGDLVAGRTSIPTSGRRVLLNMGLAMEDIAVGALVLERSLAAGLGEQVRFP